MCSMSTRSSTSNDWFLVYLRRWCFRIVIWMLMCVLFFFFQAEDGIRDVAVTGVQTCALPISEAVLSRLRRARLGGRAALRRGRDRELHGDPRRAARPRRGRALRHRSREAHGGRLTPRPDRGHLPGEDRHRRPRPLPPARQGEPDRRRLRPRLSRPVAGDNCARRHGPRRLPITMTMAATTSHPTQTARAPVYEPDQSRIAPRRPGPNAKVN